MSKALQKLIYYKILTRIFDLLDYYSIDYYANYSTTNGNSCYITCGGITIRISDHGDKRNIAFMFNFRAYKDERDIAKELLLLRKTILKGRRYNIF